MITFILLGRYFEKRSKRRAGAALRALLELGAKEVSVLRDGTEVKIPTSELTVGEQGEYVINLDPHVVNKMTLARFICDTIQQHTTQPLEGKVRMHKEGYYQIMYASKAILGPLIGSILDGKF